MGYVDVFVFMREYIYMFQNLQLDFQNSVHNFTYELNTNNKIPFLDVLIDTNISITFTNKKPASTNSCTLTYKNEFTEDNKKSVIKKKTNISR